MKTEPVNNKTDSSHEAQKNSPRSDFVDALAWIAFGVVLAIASWNMDRLESQHINPYTVPGLLPGLLGVVVIFFGGLMLWRAWRQGALDAAKSPPARRMSDAEKHRLVIVLALCLAFGVGLVGHGLPFWLAAASFVATAIVVLQYAELKRSKKLLRGIFVACIIGLGAGVAVTLIFQEFFLVRLP
jgi:hypothetical protein